MHLTAAPASPPPTLLIAEDDPQYRAVLGRLLDSRGYVTLPAATAREAIGMAGDYAPDLIILEWAMPGLSDPEALERLRAGRADGGPRLIILSRRRDEEARCTALARTADDYLVKPCSPGELIARVKAHLRRGPPLSGAVLRAGSVEMHLLSRQVRRDGLPVALQGTPYILLRHFVQNPQRLLSREHLRDFLSRPGIDRRTIDVHVRHIRNALRASGGADLFRTVRKGGYVFDPDLERGSSPGGGAMAVRR